MAFEKQELEKKVHDLLKDAEIDLDYSSVKVMEAASLILDHKFGAEYSKNNPLSVIQFTESLMANLRTNKLIRLIVNGTKYLGDSDAITFNVATKK